jgi:transcriptional regulator with PAS, ATPase and Fis domain
MKQVREVLARVAPTGSTVLILGETGTGKELAARAVHASSSRSGGPFLAVNCAALTEALLESELFGHERGAFTGAIAQKKGKFEIADGGTVFLDEVAELTLPIQAKLLRFLEERQFERLGGTRPIRIDVRLIAATNKNLEEAIRAGRFREDLFYRLHVISVTMPALRERTEDVPLLASFFVARHASKLNRKISGFSPKAHARLASYEWPGNVRELSNVIERAVVLSEGDVLGPEDLPESLLEAEDAGETALSPYHEALNETKRRLIRDAVESAGGNYTEAAKRLGLHPNYLHRLVRNLGMKEQLRR